MMFFIGSEESGSAKKASTASTCCVAGKRTKPSCYILTEDPTYISNHMQMVDFLTFF